MKTYLYLKTHNKTGLKYLGKTTQDPFSYYGSGTRWLNHLKKHGNDVSTKILYETTDANKLKEKGLYYSDLWDVVENKSFANLRPESGDGGDTSDSPLYQKGMAKRNTSGSKNGMYGRSAIKENNLKWYTNGNENIYVTEGSQPIGYYRGRSKLKRKPHSEEHKQKISKSVPKKSCISPSGEIFESRTQAAKAYGVSPTAIGGLIKRGVSGWKWL